MAENIKDPEVMRRASELSSFLVNYEKCDCILVDSNFCAMGRMIAVEACENSKYTYYDGYELLKLMELSDEEIKKITSFDEVLDTYTGSIKDLRDSERFKYVVSMYNKAIKKALEKGPALIHERGVRSYIKELGYSVMSIILYTSNVEYRRQRALVSAYCKKLVDEGMSVDEAIRRQDRRRELYQIGRAHV